MFSIGQVAAQGTVEIANNGLVGWYSDIAQTSTGDTIIATYNATLGAVQVFECNDATCTNPTISTLNSGSGDVDRSIKLLLDASDNIFLLYHDNAAGNLLLTACGTTCNDANDTAVVAGNGSDVGWHVDAALNSSTAHIVYRDDTNTESSWSVQHTTCDLNALTCASAQPVATVGSSGGFPAVALDSSGLPLIAYRDANGINYVRCTDTTCSSNTPLSITGFIPSSDHHEGYFSQAFSDGVNITFASYGVRTSASTPNDIIRIVRCDVICTSAATNIISVDTAGLFLDLAYNASGFPLISAYDLRNDAPTLLSCDDATCTTTTPITINPGVRGYFTALTTDASNNPLVAFSNYAQGDDLFLYGGAFSNTAPYVTNTTPFDGTRRAPVGVIVDIAFSEVVTPGTNAVLVNCGPGSLQFSTFTGIDANVLNTQACDVVVRAAQTPPNMTRDYNVRFTANSATTDPVLNTATSNPAAGATASTHTRIELAFDTPVNLPIGSTTLNCGSGDLPLTGLPITRQRNVTLIPVDPLPAGATCNLNISTLRGLDTGSSTDPLNFVVNLFNVSVGATGVSTGLVSADTNGLDTPQNTGYNFDTGVASTCFAFNANSNAFFASTNADAFVNAVNNANANDTIKLAGTCTADVDPGDQLVSISQNLTLQGGYPTTFNMANPGVWLTITDPATNPTTIDAAGFSRHITHTAGNLVVDGLTFINGSAFDGGALNTQNANAIVRNSIFRNNMASNDGGALYQNGTGLLTVQRTLIEDNTAIGAAGGGIWAGFVSIEESQLLNNQANTFGGGVVTVAELGIRNSLISGNSATDGGGVSVFNGIGAIRNATIAHNTATQGGGLSLDSFNSSTQNVDLFNSILWGNSTTNNSPQIFINPTEGTLDINETIVEGGFTGNNAVDALTDDPLFLDAANDDYRIQPYSNAINAGDNANAQGSTDLDANPRINGPLVDLGAYERQGDLCHLQNFNTGETLRSPSGDVLQAIHDSVTTLDTHVIRIAGVCTADSSLAGGNLLTMSKNLTLEGGWTPDFILGNRQPGIIPTILDGIGVARVLDIQASVTDSTIVELTIRNGAATDGAGIRNAGTLTSFGGVLQNNIATGNGGAISNSSTYTANGGSFTGNSATTGGAISNSGDMDLLNGSITNNQADAGGAISTSGGSAFTEVMTIANNTATSGNGGGVLHTVGTLTLSRTDINNNTASNGDGGGIYSVAPSTTFVASNTLMHRNTAPNGNGGAVYNTSRSVMTQMTVADNSASAGSGFYNDTGGNIRLFNSLVWGNVTDQIVNNATFETNSTFVEGGFNSTSFGFAQSIDPQFLDPANADYRLTLGTNVIDAGQTDNIRESGTFTQVDFNGDGDTFDTLTEDLVGNPRAVSLQNPIGDPPDPGVYEAQNVCAVRNTRTTQQLEAQFITDANNILQQIVDAAQAGDTIEITGECIAADDFTGAQMINIDKTLTLRGFRFPTRTQLDANQAGRADDGRIITHTAGTLTVDTIQMLNGFAFDGGGINTSADLILRSSFVQNSTAERDGGGIYQNTSGNVTLENSFVTGNSAQDASGGGIWALDATIANSFITGNQAPNFVGGGVVTLNSLNISNSLFYDNIGGEGGAVSVYSGSATITNATIVDNRASVTGGGVAVGGNGTPTLTLNNSIVYDNNAGSNAQIADNGTVNISATLVQSGFDGDNGVAALIGDPRFIDPLTNDYTFLSDSDAFNAGDNTLVVGSTDLAGFNRIAGGIVDLGAYEQRETCFLQNADTDQRASGGEILNGTNYLQTIVDDAQPGHTIRISGGCYANVSLAGNTLLSVDKNLTIEGGWNTDFTERDVNDTPGVLNGNGVAQVLNIAPGATLTVDGTTIQNGATITGASASGIENQGTLILSDSQVRDHTTADIGAILNHTGATLIVRDSFVTDNGRDNGNGGGIVNQGTLIMTNSILARNFTQTGQTAALLNEGNATLTNSVISRNTVVGTGNVGGVTNVNAATLNLNNSIIWDNSAQEVLNNGTLNLRNTIVQGGSTLIGNNGEAALLFDPLFVDGPNGDFTLQSTSLAIDVGRNDLLTENNADVLADYNGDGAVTSFTIPSDLNGAARVFGPSVDLGAYELQQDICFVSNTDGSYAGATSEIRDGLSNILQIAVDQATAGSTVRIAGNCISSSAVPPSALMTIDKDLTVQGGYPVDVNNVPDFNAVPNPVANPTLLNGANSTQGIVVNSGTVTLTGLVVEESRVDGINIRGGTTTLTNSITRQNSGRGLVNGATLNITESDFNNNIGGIANYGVMTIDNSTISDNTVNGGIASGGRTSIDNSTIQNNSTQNSGGGIFVFGNGDLTLTNSTISGNFAGGNNVSPFQVAATGGGGIFAQVDSFGTVSLDIHNNTIENNTTDVAGGGLNLNDNNLESLWAVSNNIISGNIAERGGGLYIGSLVLAQIEGNLLTGNSTSGLGGGVYADSVPSGFGFVITVFRSFNDQDTPALLANNTISANDAPEVGGIYVAGLISLHNSIVWGNSNLDIAAGPGVPPADLTGVPGVITGLLGGSSSEIYFRNTIVEGGGTGTGGGTALNVDPQFINPATGNFRLTAGSPAVDAGANALVTLSNDLDGNVRIVNSVVDLGAYENQGVSGGTSITITGFDATPDHVLGGETTLHITITQTDAENGVPTTTIAVLYSADATCSADDVQIAEIPVTSETITADVSIPRGLLAQQAASAQDIGYLCALSASDLDTANSIDATANKLIVADDITYFPYDGDGDGLVTPSDAMSAINALGTANMLHDADGNGVVSPSEAIAVLLMLGEQRDDTAIEHTNTATDAPSGVPTLPVAGR